MKDTFINQRNLKESFSPQSYENLFCGKKSILALPNLNVSFSRSRKFHILFLYIYRSVNSYFPPDFEGRTLRGTIDLRQFRVVALPALAAFEISTPDRTYYLQPENSNISETHG
jgi:hypothetical protein